MQKKRLLSNILLLLATLVWGLAFVVASVAAEQIGPFTLNCLRFLIGFAALQPVIRIMDHGKKPSFEQKGGRSLLVGGCFCGLAIASATVVQQAGLPYSTAGKAGFLTALYIIFVPILGIFFGRRPALRVWIAAGMGLFGIYLLSMTESLTIGRGDLMMIACAVAFAAHFMLVDRFCPIVDGLRLSAMQFLVAGLLCLLPMLIFERPSLADLIAAAPALLYMGVLSSGLGYTCQIVAQKYTEPVTASLICSFESVFAALAGWALLNEVMSGRELLGCGLLFLAIILAQLPHRPQKGASPKS